MKKELTYFLPRMLMLIVICLLSTTFLWAAGEEVAVEEGPPESDFISRAEIMRQLQQANIDWKQCKGDAINIAMQSESDIWDMERLELFDLFEELTGIKFNYTIFEEVQLREKTTVDYLTGTGIYDAAMSGIMYLSTYAKADKVQDLRPYIDNPKLTDKEWLNLDDFPKGFRDMGTFNGKILGWPVHLSGQLMYWNKEYFKRYGLDPERGPDNFDELWEFAKKCHHPEDGVYGVALRGLRGGGLNVFAWSSFMKAFGGEWFDKNWEPQLDSKEVIDSIKYYSDLITTYGPPGVANWEWSKIMTAMAE